jgi:hypothetical protein
MTTGRHARLDRITLNEWRTRLAEMESCPYVGPRPQRSADGRRKLVAREGAMDRISRAAIDRRLVVLDGYSGSGKTSLLLNGLQERLEEANFGVFTCRHWPKRRLPARPSIRDVESYLVDAIVSSHESIGAALPAGIDLRTVEAEGLAELLDATFEGSALLMFDQFEELLRYELETARAVMGWVRNLGFRHESHVVVSLRTDSMHLLEPMLRGVRPFSMDRIHLEEP